MCTGRWHSEGFLGAGWLTTTVAFEVYIIRKGETGDKGEEKGKKNKERRGGWDLWKGRLPVGKKMTSI